jgi:hypothetical protein
LLRGCRFVTLLLTALALTMTSAHVLEMHYEAELYSAVNTTLYRYFAVVGGVYTPRFPNGPGPGASPS